MTGIERLRDIVDDGPYSGGMIHISVHKLREICEQIEGEVDDISERESDVLGWVEKNGGLGAVKERTCHPERVSTAYHSAIVCSECKHRLDEVTLYCPFCGSRLEGIGR